MKKTKKGIGLILSVILFFCISGTVVFSISCRITNEMEASAIDNLSESLNLIGGTLEAILKKEAEFQQLIAQEVATTDDPEEFIRSYNENRSMVKISLLLSGETEEIGRAHV